ncbi:APC family permease [Schlesneria paludicola]|uniref:APC family permease n=1 Tax=Schlesneria paludicola TaxID=360056 RepID=UPI00029AF38A|nr:amino acid permease [Schlesneria paludicola]
MTNAEPVAEIGPKTLPRVLGLFDATALVVGSIIGSGIFLKVGNVDQALMSWGFLPIILVWIFVGLITLCGSLALAELAAMFPQAGGPYLYLREAYGRLPAFLWGWTEFWVVRTGSVGALACATVIYLDEFLRPPGNGEAPLGHLGQSIIAVSIIIGLSAVNMFSTRWGAVIQNIATVTKVGFLGLLITLPFLMGKMNVDNLHPLWVPNPVDTPLAVSGESPVADSAVPLIPKSLFTALGLALIAVFWPFDGWINIAPVAEDIREPQSNIPRALAIGIGIVCLVYVGANISYHLVLPMPEVAKSTRLASDVFRVMFGEWGSKFAALGVCCSTFGAANSNLICGPRIYVAASRDGLVPDFIQRVHPLRLTPSNSILVQGVWTTFLIIVFYIISPEPKKVFDLITDAVICAGLIFYSLTVGAVYILRSRRPDADRPYRTWGYPWTPALLISSYVIALVGTLVEQWQQLVWVLVLIAAGAVYYAIVTRRTKTEATTEPT